LVSGTSFNSKKITKILKKIPIKNIPSGPGVRKKFIPDPGGQKAPDRNSDRN
jgi:hypothetical protein